MRNIRRKSKRKYILILFFFVLFAISGIGLSFLPWFSGAPYVSPIPKTLLFGKNIPFFREDPESQLKKALLEAHIQFSSISAMSDASYSVMLENGEEILFSTKKSFTGQISSLQLILSRLTIEGKRFALLDVRFDKPVIILK